MGEKVIMRCSICGCEMSRYYWLPTHADYLDVDMAVCRDCYVKKTTQGVRE